MNMKIVQTITLNLGLISLATVFGCETPGCKNPGELASYPYCSECWAVRPENKCERCGGKIPQMQYTPFGHNFCYACSEDIGKENTKNLKVQP